MALRRVVFNGVVFNRLVLKSLFTLSMFMLSACGDPLQILQQEIKKSGYILYRTPLEEAGTGTLVGGSPKTLSIVAHPDSCFPDPETGPILRRIENAAVGNLNQKVSFKGDLKIDLLNFMGNANSMFSIKAGFSIVDEIELEIKGAKVEYLDSVVLHETYFRLSPTCKNFLDQVAFIIQGLRVDEMTFAFKRKDGGYIRLEADAIQEIMDIGIDVEFEVTQDFFLTFKTPKYIGYQLGRLRKSDEGMTLFRATKTMGNKFLFKSLGLFEDEDDSNDGVVTPFGTFSRLARTQNDEPVEIPHEQLIDPFSIFKN